MARGAGRGSYGNGGGRGNRGSYGRNSYGRNEDGNARGDRGGYGRNDQRRSDRGPLNYRRYDAGAPPAPGQEATIPAVDQDKWYPKRALLPYRSKAGGTFNRIGGARNDSDVLDTRHIAQRNTHMNCEAMNRAAKWVSMVAGSSPPRLRLGYRMVNGKGPRSSRIVLT